MKTFPVTSGESKTKTPTQRYNRRVGFVPYTQRHGYILNGVPKPHMRRLQKESTRRDTSVTNVVGQILANRYQLAFSPSTRNHVPVHDGATVSFRLPHELFTAVTHEAISRNVTVRSVILDALSQSFKLKAPEPTPVPGRRPGRPRKD